MPGGAQTEPADPGAPDVPATVLALRDIHVSYGAVKVLFGVDIEVAAGERVALLGTNGAGKSTVLKVAAGHLRPDRGSAGRVELDGIDVTESAPEERAESGLILLSGGRSTFPSLTVEENLRIGAFPLLSDRAEVDRRVENVVDRFEILARRRRQRAGTLSGGEQQLLALGRALVAQPSVLLIDELSLGLSPTIVEEVLKVVDEFTRRGTTMLIVEQSLNVAASITERAYFMEKGEVRFSGPTATLQDRGDVARSVFFGGQR